MDNFSNQPLTEKKSGWPYAVIIILVALLAIAGTVIYYQNRMAEERGETYSNQTPANNGTANYPKTENKNSAAAGEKQAQTPGQAATSSGGNTTPENTSTEINLPPAGNIKLPGQTPKVLSGGGHTLKPKATVYVYLYNDSLTPRTLEVATGTRVIWKNEQWVAHYLIDRAGDFQSSLIGQDEEYSYIFTQPGRHDYFDRFNQKGVYGTIIVK